MDLLHGVISEMHTRFGRFEQISGQYRKVETIEQYRALQQESLGNGDAELTRPLPYLIVMIDQWHRDEACDMDPALLRLLPRASAVGIHVLMTATHPERIPGVITSYMPTRIAFACASQESCLSLLGVDRRGRFRGRGDMLVKRASSTALEYIQTPLVTDEEKTRLTNLWVNRS